MRRWSELGEFWDTLAAAARRCLLLDYDGTLAPFRVERDQALPYPGVSAALDSIIAGRHTRVVIISGRPVQDLPQLLGLKRLPEIWRSHGLERLATDGGYAPPVLPADIAAGLPAARREVEVLDLMTYIEEKPGSLALHWRGLDGAAAAQLREAVYPQWNGIAGRSRLKLSDFDGGLELRSELISKADAVAQVLATEPLDACAAYLGDDLTDEDAFSAIAGRGLGVLVRPELRATAATAWIVPPDELLAFLDRWQEACH